jgi:hypothetical protein
MHEESKLCEHLRPVGEYLRSRGARVSYAGQAWSDQCRYWVYFATVLDVDDLRKRFSLPESVVVHENLDERSGTERGLVCEVDRDAVMGLLPLPPRR